MSFRLNKDELSKKAELVEKLRDAREKVGAAAEQFNAEVADLKGDVEQAVADYNAIAQEARDFAEQLSGERDEEFSDKSEKWQEGDKGQAARSFIDEWQGATFDDIEVTWPDDLEIDAEDAADTLEGLSDEAAE